MQYSATSKPLGVKVKVRRKEDWEYSAKMKIECPVSGLNAENCESRKRYGSVRDDKSTGIIECKNCLLVTHEKDLSHKVNYELGTMHKDIAIIPVLEKPDTDLNRRVNSLKTLAHKYHIKSILDYGCGKGNLVSALQHNFKAIGIEIDSRTREIAKNNVKMGSIYDSLVTFKMLGILVDVVTMIHVVEHFYEPSKELKSIYEMLNPGGLIVIETPNSNDALITKYENLNFQNHTYWSHHPMLHSHKSLSLLVQRNGFKILECGGVQRYDINNHLYWLSKGEPGGHVKWMGMFSEDTIQNYGRDLVKNSISDTLWLVAQKNY